MLCVYMYDCVCGILPILCWFIGPHESFTKLNEIVCFFHYKQDQNYVGAACTIVVFLLILVQTSPL